MAVLKTTILLFSLIVLSHQKDEDRLEIQQMVFEAVQSLYGSATLSPMTANLPSVEPKCKCASAVNWTSIPMSVIGKHELTVTGTLSNTMPPEIPSNAKEVLIFCVVQVASTQPSGHPQYIKIYTRENFGGKYMQYEKYMYALPYPQNAVVTNSDNFWLPMTTNRLLFIQLTTVFRGNAGVNLYAIGYR